MNAGGRVLSDIFSKDPWRRFREKLFLQASGSRVRLLDFSDVEGRLVDSYTLELGEMYRPRVYIFDCGGFGCYLVREPVLDAGERECFDAILGYLLSSANIEGERCSVELLEEKVMEVVRGAKLDVSREKVRLFSEIIFRETSGYGVLEPLMSDDNVTDISCSSYTQPVFVRHREYSEYGWMGTNVSFSEGELDSLVQRMASKHGRGVSILSPASEITTGDGHRIMLTFKNEITLPSSTFSIRKFPKRPWTIAKLISYGTLNEDLAAYLWQALENRQFLIIAGSMGSGKTTLLSTLLQLTDLRCKVLTIEDTAEIALGDRVNWQRLITRRGLRSEVGDVSLIDLTMLSLRTSSDYVALGEVRGSEVQALVQAAGTGLGCITTFHAGDLQELFSRMKGKPLSVEDSFLQTIKCVVFLSNVKGVEGKVLKKVNVVEEPYLEDRGLGSRRVYDREVDGEGVGLDAIFSRSRVFEKVRDEAFKAACRKRDFLKSAVRLKAYTFDRLQPHLLKFYGDEFGG